MTKLYFHYKDHNRDVEEEILKHFCNLTCPNVLNRFVFLCFFSALLASPLPTSIDDDDDNRHLPRYSHYKQGKEMEKGKQLVLLLLLCVIYLQSDVFQFPLDRIPYYRCMSV